MNELMNAAGRIASSSSLMEPQIEELKTRIKLATSTKATLSKVAESNCG